MTAATHTIGVAAQPTHPSPPPLHPHPLVQADLAAGPFQDFFQVPRRPKNLRSSPPCSKAQPLPPTFSLLFLPAAAFPIAPGVGEALMLLLTDLTGQH